MYPIPTHPTFRTPQRHIPPANAASVAHTRTTWQERAAADLAVAGGREAGGVGAGRGGGA